MVQCGHGQNVCCQQAVDQAVVKIQAARFHCPGAQRQDAGPADRKAVGIDTERLQEGHIVGHVVVMVAGDICSCPIQNAVRLMIKAVPDALTLAVFIPGAFDLKGSGGCAPDEILWKFVSCHWPSFVNPLSMLQLNRPIINGFVCRFM